MYLGPGFAVYSLLLNKVALHSFASVALWRFPGESAGSSGDVTHLQISWGSGQVYKHTEPAEQCTSATMCAHKGLRHHCREVEGLTKHRDSDFDHLVSSGTLSIDDVSATVGQFALWDNNE